jgi:hypothetical protein
VGAREDRQSGPRNPAGDPAQIQRWGDRILGTGRGQGRRFDIGQLAVVDVAAQPRVLGGDLGAGRRRRDVEVIGNLAAATGVGQTVDEAAALPLAMGRVELAQDVGDGRIGLAVDGLSPRRAQHGVAAARVGRGEDQVRDTAGMPDRQPLRDEAAHRPAQHVGP